MVEFDGRMAWKPGTVGYVFNYKTGSWVQVIAVYHRWRNDPVRCEITVDGEYNTGVDRWNSEAFVGERYTFWPQAIRKSPPKED